jgi:NDP-sugar pyrophosphorylase family protein
VIHSAVLLAAGRGKRQRPYTDVTPKPLLPVQGRPMLDYVLRAVQQAGAGRACIVTHHLEEQIFAYVGDGARWGLDICFARQAVLRGNGDALLSVPPDWRRGEPLLVAATDYALDENALLELAQAHERHRAAIVMSLKECPPEELAARSTVQVDGDGRVRRIIEKPRPEEILSPYAASILFILPPQIWEYLARTPPSPRGEIEMQAAIDAMIRDGYPAFGVLQPAPREWTAPQQRQE